MSFAVETLVVTPIQQNCRLLIDKTRQACVVIDPGGDAEKILELIRSRSCTLESIWLTHSHLDHCGGVADLMEAFPDAELIAHPGETDFRSRVEAISMMYGMPPGVMKNCPEPSTKVSGGEILTFAGQEFAVLFTPGHSPGHVSFYNEQSGRLFSGDVLFAGSIGRYDLPGSDGGVLMHSIHEVLMSLPDETIVFPGHGPETSIGQERKENPFVKGEINV